MTNTERTIYTVNNKGKAIMIDILVTPYETIADVYEMQGEEIKRMLGTVTTSINADNEYIEKLADRYMNTVVEVGKGYKFISSIDNDDDIANGYQFTQQFDHLLCTVVEIKPNDIMNGNEMAWVEFYNNSGSRFRVKKGDLLAR